MQPERRRDHVLFICNRSPVTTTSQKLDRTACSQAI